jgi:hypothetical protein
MMRTTPLRRITLQFLQILLTEACTFMGVHPLSSYRRLPERADQRSSPALP